jgi:hypothetical protein
MLPIPIEAIIAAIREKRTLRVWYDPGIRIIEPHTLGRGAQGQLLLRAFQVSGASASGKRQHWKMFRCDGFATLETGDPGSEAPRPGYKRGDRDMKGGIIEEV